MMKRIVLSLMLAGSLSAAAAPAEAGIFRDAAKKVVRGSKDLVGLSLLSGRCVMRHLRGQGPDLLCR